MEKIAQPWEKKNLGVNSVEFRFDGTEKIEEIGNDVLAETEFDYQLCRVPVGRMDIMYLLQENGFRFAETSFELSADLKNLTLPKVYERYEESIHYCKLEGIEEEEKLYSLIRSGIFDTDKIYLDPFFKKEQSGVRFANWCQQEVSAGRATCYTVESSEEKIGFFVIKEVSDKVSDSLLAGLYDNKKSMGMGFAVLYYPMLKAKMDGKRRMVMAVSSNNPSSVRLHLELGYKIKGMNYVLIKHI